MNKIFISQRFVWMHWVNIFFDIFISAGDGTWFFLISDMVVWWSVALLDLELSSVGSKSIVRETVCCTLSCFVSIVK